MEKSVYETAKNLKVTAKYAFGAMTWNGLNVWEITRMNDDAILGCWNRDEVSYLEALGLLFKLGINVNDVAFV